MLTLAIGDLYIPERSIQLPSKFKKLLSPNPQSIPTNNKIGEVICLGNIVNSMETLKFLYNLSPSFNLVKGEFDNAQILSQQLLSLSNQELTIPLYKIIVQDNLRIGFTNGFQIVPKNDPSALLTLARELDVDILIWGGTHKVEAYTLDGKFFINPGSATGAYTFDWPDNDKYDEDEEEEDKETPEENNEEKNEVKNEEKKTEDGKKVQEQESKEPTESKVEKSDLFADTTPEVPAKSKSTEIDLEVFKKVTELTSITPSFCLLDTHGSTCTLYIYTYLNGEVKVDKVTYQKE